MPQTHSDHCGRHRGGWAAEAAPLALAAASAAAPAFGQDAEVADLRRQLAAIQARLETLEADAAEREAAAKEEAAATFETDRDGVTLRFGGRINQALLYASQGDQDQAFIADNDASGSRFEFLGTTALGDWTTGAEIVISAEINSTDDIDFGETLDASLEEVEFRQAHWFFEHPAYGYISIGQGDTAAEDTMRVDLSGTHFAGAGSDVDDIAGGLTFVADDGTELAELDDFFDALDGSRALRVLYRSPEARWIRDRGLAAEQRGVA